MRVCVSRCLLGVPCRYDGRARLSEAVARFARHVSDAGGTVIDVCPEVAGGLPTPREPAEILGSRVVTASGVDVSEAFRRGAEASLALVSRHPSVPLAVLCGKSPSCGSSYVYDGTHTGRLVAGDGVFSRLLKERGVDVADEKSVEACRPSVEHPVALVLGTGLGHLAGLVKPVRRIPYPDIPGFPASAEPLPGHRFEATVGTISGVPVIVYPGRVHHYQGYDALEVTSLVRHAHRLGCRVCVFACATGAVRGMAEPGLGVISDHVNLTGLNPLVGWERISELSRVDTDFFDMADVYTPYLRGLARGVAEDEGIALGEGGSCPGHAGIGTHARRQLRGRCARLPPERACRRAQQRRGVRAPRVRHPEGPVAHGASRIRRVCPGDLRHVRARGGARAMRGPQRYGCDVPAGARPSSRAPRRRGRGRGRPRCARPSRSCASLWATSSGTPGTGRRRSRAG